VTVPAGETAGGGQTFPTISSLRTTVVRRWRIAWRVPMLRSVRRNFVRRHERVNPELSSLIRDTRSRSGHWPRSSLENVRSQK